MNFRFQNLLGGPYRGGNVVMTEDAVLLSSDGNRVAATDLFKFQTQTLPFEPSCNISRIVASPDGAFLLAVGNYSRALFVNLRRRAVLHRITFKRCVIALRFSPDSSVIAVGLSKLLQIWRSPGFRGQNKPFLFLGHRDAIVGAFFSAEKKSGRVFRVYTVSKNGAIFTWNLVESHDIDASDGLKQQNNSGGSDAENSEIPLHSARWELLKKDFFMQSPAKLTACDYHRELDMVVVGFSNGVFGLYQMPDFVCIHLLSISREKITTVVFNKLGNWLTFGCAKLGQLLVWEWRSESYILKQQGHYFDVNCIAYSPDSQMLATGADDNKLKVWTVSSGFCFITLSEHTNAVTAFVSLSSDPSGEVICAGTLDSFEIFVWSMKTGRLLDVLGGHEGPVHGLMFSPTNPVLASSSWDKTVRLWDVFEGKGAVETFPHTHNILTVVYRPDGKQLACSTLDGHIHFWDPIDGLLMYTIEGCRDIAGGRLMTDRRSASNSSSGKYFTALCYSADGSYIFVGGNSKYICMYDIADQVLLHRFQITRNLSLDGVLDFLNVGFN
ncbi:hypothetical protein OPV22_016435 [Ensete ventricosum]|uniref:Anaphase-promoting complex subunit 4 WD40 domain-containing protein n=1 Tax=Ensete ventricosum TaxID=4639 RepID=A0AAV8QRJ6_ENSVE|nr:hypothetical protein OPV22_016435 [Ensete ventricosum]